MSFGDSGAVVRAVMSSQAKPNIVVIWAPDVEAGQLGCYSRGRSCTPNIDSLAREGMLFFNSALESGGTAAVEFMSGQSTAPGTLARAGVSPNGRRHDATAPNADVATHVDDARFWDLLVEAIASFD